MRIVAVADTHLYHDELVVPDGDVFVHAGDLCRAGDLDELAVAAAWIRALPHAHKVVVAGNHDGAFEQDSARARALLGPDVVYLEDALAVVAGLRVWGAPWTPAYNDWAFNLPRGDALGARWALIPPGLDLLVTHGPPRGVGDASSVAGRHGCDALRARVAAVCPRAHVFGHIHADGGAWAIDGTLFANVTTWECERAPTVLELDPGGGPARVISAPPSVRT